MDDVRGTTTCVFSHELRVCLDRNRILFFFLLEYEMGPWGG